MNANMNCDTNRRKAIKISEVLLLYLIAEDVEG
jgi:hypothetical protein